jgi:hypothetical protein
MGGAHEHPEQRGLADPGLAGHDPKRHRRGRFVEPGLVGTQLSFPSAEQHGRADVGAGPTGRAGEVVTGVERGRLPGQIVEEGPGLVVLG